MAEKNPTGGTFSVIGNNTFVTGNIRTEGSIRVDGKVVGNIVTQADAAVGLNGVVEGSVDARNITIAGKVMGTLTAAHKLILEGKAVMKGDIRTARLVVDEGAVFDGRSSMTGVSSSPPPMGRESR
ncbi:MAG TPA: polymer-forming cytoskeletal protein [Bacteroidota bacterium]|nr:polymer-forming cytoskeletal protein [Bacteroidota bacterium]